MRWISTVALLVTTLVTAGPSHAQDSTHVPVLIVPAVRTLLAAEWREHLPNRAAVERAYCVTPRRSATGSFIAVVNIARPDSVTFADPYHIQFYCPEGTLGLHVHTPTTCDQSRAGDVLMESCQRGGIDAFICEPSPTDREALRLSEEPFGLIQCDEHAIITYWRGATP